MVYIEESLEKFKQLPLEVVLTIDDDGVANMLARLGEKYKADFYTPLISLSVGDLAEEELPNYLRLENDLDETGARMAADEFKQQVLDKLEKRINFLNADVHKPMTVAEEKGIIIDIFSADLVRELRGHHLLVQAVNDRIFNVLRQDIGFKVIVEKALYQNHEIMTNKRFVLDEKEREASIMNWLSYFIKFHGTDMPDGVILSDFITKSENAKRLDEDEKKLVYKLIATYRNIKFFPDSMPSDNGEGWEIIPFERALASSVSIMSRPARPPRLSDRLGGAESQRYEPGSFEWQVVEEESKRELERRKLQALAKKYPEGSLERQAVEEELRKLSL